MKKNITSRKKNPLSAPKADIGLIGLAVMGANLARNLASRKIKTVVFNRTAEKTEQFIQIYGSTYLQGEKTLKSFVENIALPRKIIIMVQAGNAVDIVLQQLAPFLKKGDTIIDCGNSYYEDTERRFIELKKEGLHFIGCGVSGGEEGALNGPSLMPGGSKETWISLKKIFEKIAAKDFHGKPCVTYIGDGASGHFVKMVHNGIEYGIMQIMAEAYDLLRKLYQLSPLEISAIFKKLNQGKLRSYLFEIAEKVLKQKDDYQKGYLVDFILDKAGQKGTGTWTSHQALEQGIALPTITEAVFARIISGEKEKRLKLSKIYKKNIEKVLPKKDLKNFIALLEDALYAAIISTYAQGYDFIEKMAEKKNWQIQLDEISRIWEGGCIIRAEVLNFFHKAYATNSNSRKHLFEIKAIAQAMNSSIPALREIVSMSTKNGIPTMGFASSLFYFEEMVQARGSAHFIQGLRDYFGAHTYERIDRNGIFHTKWE